VAFHPTNQRCSCILEILIELRLEIQQAADGLLSLELVVTLVDEGTAMRPHEILVASASRNCRFLRWSRWLYIRAVQIAVAIRSSDIQIFVLVSLRDDLWRAGLWQVLLLRAVKSIFQSLTIELDAYLIHIIFKQIVQVCVVHVLECGLFLGFFLSG
jgi:hypothetical protein